MAVKFWAHGAKVRFNSVLVGGLTSIGLPAQSKDEVEVTSHDSQGWREFVPGLRDGGTVALTCRLRPGDSGQRELYENFNGNGEVAPFSIECPPDPDQSNFILTFSGMAYVSEVGGDLPFDDAGEATFTLRIDGIVNRNDISI